MSVAVCLCRLERSLLLHLQAIDIMSGIQKKAETHVPTEGMFKGMTVKGPPPKEVTHIPTEGMFKGMTVKGPPPKDSSYIATDGLFAGMTVHPPKQQGLSPLLGGQPQSQQNEALHQGFVREVYQQKRYYHGTNEQGQESIQSQGMSVNAKTQGATVAALGNLEAQNSEFGKTAQRHNYLTKDKKVAMRYANTSVFDGQDQRRPDAEGRPKLLRAFGPFAGLEKDTDSDDRLQSFRTAQDIPKDAFRQKKGDGRYSQSILQGVQEDVFQQHGVRMRSEFVARHLSAGDSDSDDDDFGSVRRMKVK